MLSAQLIQSQIQAVFSELNYLIRLLYSTQDPYMKNLLLNQLWNKIANLHFLVELLNSQQSKIPGPPVNSVQMNQPAVQQLQNQSTGTQQTFTREQLAQFNGKNGKPAYVAVNGIVYDVTDNAAWSAATHFGLTAGKDLTQEFASCHAGQQWILGTLKPIGRLVD